MNYTKIGHVIYADGITTWTNMGLFQSKTQDPQNAVNWVTELAAENGLKCAPQKFELIRIDCTSKTA